MVVEPSHLVRAVFSKAMDDFNGFISLLDNIAEMGWTLTSVTVYTVPYYCSYTLAYDRIDTSRYLQSTMILS